MGIEYTLCPAGSVKALAFVQGRPRPKSPVAEALTLERPGAVQAPVDVAAAVRVCQSFEGIHYARDRMEFGTVRRPTWMMSSMQGGQ